MCGGRSRVENESWRIIAALAALAFVGGCGGPGGGPAAPDDEPEPPAADPCAGVVLDSLLARLEQERPTWDQVDCFTGDLTRLPEPDFVERILADSEKFGQQTGLLAKHLAYWDDIVSTYAPNVSPALMAAVPPYADDRGVPLAYPLSPTWLDELLRASAAVFIREKRAGRRVLVQLLYPPGTIDLGFTDEASFRAWIDTDFTRELTALAEMAERIKAEYLMPLPIELEVFVNNQSGFIDDLSETQKVALAQDIADKAIQVTRPRFRGKIGAFSYVNYHVDPAPDYWADVRFTGYDFVSFSAFPACDLPTTDAYVDGQLDRYLTIVRRDNVAWWLGELTLQEKLFAACDKGGATFMALKDDLLDLVLTKLDTLSPPPAGVMVRADPPPDDPPEVVEVLRGYFGSR